MINAVLFRNGKEIQRMVVTDHTPDIRVPHAKPLHPGDWDRYVPGSLIEMFQEVFQRFDWTCPCCNCVVFNSTNYMEAPDWFYKKVIGGF